MTSLTRTSSHTVLGVLEALRTDRALTVVRADHIPDAAQLCRALAEGGIRTVELTFTAFLAAGATAVCAGTSVVPPAAVARGDWTEITERARTFAAAVTPSPES
jgi:2-keto-3-deoxy-6-phosphogluconate aldolase